GGGHGVGIFVGIAGGRIAGYDRFGTPLSGWPRRGPTGFDDISGGPALGDLDGDGVLEVVAAGTDGRIWAWRVDGTPVARFPVSTDGTGFAGGLALSDLDGAPGAEIIAATQAGEVYAFDHTGTGLEGWPEPRETPATSRGGA